MANIFTEAFNNGLAITRMEAQLHKESVNLYLFYLLTRNVNVIHKAVHCAREAVRCGRKALRIAPGLPFLVRPDVRVVVHLGRTLLRKFQHTRQVEDITEAFDLFRHASSLFTDDTDDIDNLLRQQCFAYLSISYLEQGGNLDELIGLGARHACNQSRPSLETLNQNLGEDDEVYEYIQIFNEGFGIQYNTSHRRIEDIETGIQFCRGALGVFPSNSDRSAETLINLGNYLIARFGQRNRLEDIDEAIERCYAGLELWSCKSETFSRCQAIASTACIKRFLALGRREDLDDAVRLASQAVELVTTQYSDFAKNPEFAFCWDRLSHAMLCRYDITQDVSDLDAAIDASSCAVDIAEGDENLPHWLNNLALCLITRYTRSNRAEDLSQMILTAQRAVDCLPEKHSERAAYLVNLNKAELLQTLALQDPESCVRRAAEQAGRLILQTCNTPQMKAETSLYVLMAQAHFHLLSWSDSSIILLDVQERRRRIRAIDEAIKITRVGVSHFIPHHPLALGSHLYISILLHKRWTLTYDIKNLDEAISVLRRMIKMNEVMAVAAEFLVHARTGLGKFLYSRFKSTGDNRDCEEALSVLHEGFRMPGPLYVRINPGGEAIAILSDKADWDSAHKLSREIIDIFVILNDRSQAWANKETFLRKFSFNAAFYASIALEAGSNALEVIDMLETCRGSILGHLLDKRAELDDLMEAAPDKARRFKTLQDELNTEIHPSTNTNTYARQTKRRIDAEGEIRACLEEIRTLEGFDRFLLGPTERGLNAAAARGPILIVNVSALRSDTIIITKNAFDLLPLPGLKWEKVQMYTGEDLTNFNFGNIGQKNIRYRQMLAWLWDNCVKLVLEKLEDMGYGPAKFHVWWMGVGLANFLPFHAAGKYTSKVSETALSRLISSYIPTLKVLIDSQRKLRGDTLKLGLQRLTIMPERAEIKPRLTLITMPCTPGMNDLDGVQREAEVVQKILGDTFSTQVLVQPSAKTAMAHVAESEIVHFACHGISDKAKASSSHLVLQATTSDSTIPAIDELRVRDVVDADLGRGKLAVLSACSTAQNSVKRLCDEALHLGSAFQVAGYMHVIGNLWPSDDDRSVELVEGFYKHLVAAGEFDNGENVARALNEALLGVAGSHPKDPLSWAQFVHFGC